MGEAFLAALFAGLGYALWRARDDRALPVRDGVVDLGELIEEAARARYRRQRLETGTVRRLPPERGATWAPPRRRVDGA